MIKRSLEEIVSMIQRNGVTTSIYSPEYISIQGVSIDSRTIKEGNLFVPIVRIDDGHNYVLKAFENGAVAALWQADHDFIPEGFPLIIVNDTLKALQNLAQAYREQLSCKVIGITGSNGKTTVKDMTTSILSTKYKVHKTHGNLNGMYGLPLTLLEVEEDTEVVVLEMGMSNAGEIKNLSEIAKPDYAVITMIGLSHLSSLGSREGIASAKLEILEGLNPNGAIIINGDEPLLTEALPKLQLPQIISIIRFGESHQNDYFPLTISQNSNGLTFTLNRYKSEFFVPLLGQHNISNALASMALAECMQMKEQDIHSGLTQLELTGMRMERIYSPRGFLIINDSWNASPVSMKAAIETIANMEGYHQKVLVLGDMMELGDQEHEFHEEIASSIDPSHIHSVYTIGNLSRTIVNSLRNTEFEGEVKHFTSKEELVSACNRILSNEDVILVKGSRSLKLEEICEALNQ